MPDLTVSHTFTYIDTHISTRAHNLRTQYAHNTYIQYAYRINFSCHANTYTRAHNEAEAIGTYIVR